MLSDLGSFQGGLLRIVTWQNHSTILKEADSVTAGSKWKAAMAKFSLPFLFLRVLFFASHDSKQCCEADINMSDSRYSKTAHWLMDGQWRTEIHASFLKPFRFGQKRPNCVPLFQICKQWSKPLPTRNDLRSRVKVIPTSDSSFFMCTDGTSPSW